MKLSIKNFTVFFTIIFLICFPSIQFLKAYEGYEIDIPATSIMGNPLFKSIQMANGKFVYAIGSSDDKIHLYVFNSEGEQLAYTVGTLTSLATLDRFEISLYDNGTYCIIMGYVRTTGADCYQIYAKLHMTSYIFTYIGKTNTASYSSSGSGVLLQVSKIYVDNGAFFCIMANDGSHPYTVLAKMTYAGSISVLTLSSSQLFAGYIFSFQDPISPRYIYVLSGKPTETTRPIYYKIDLNGAGSETELAEHPFAGFWRSDVDSAITLRYLGGGIREGDTPYYWLYHTWVIGDTDGSYLIVNQRLIFNNSVISPSYFVEQDTLDFSVGSMCYGLSDDISICGGYESFNSQTNVSTIYIYHVSRFGSPTYDFYSAKQQFHSDSWFSTSASMEIDEKVLTTEFVYGSGDYLYLGHNYKVMTTPYQIQEVYPYTEHTIIYSGLLVSERQYNITSSYLPTGDLYTLTQYQFTATLRMNGVVHSGAQITIKMDNATIGTKTTDANGQIKFNVLSTVSGYHILSYTVYDEGQYQTDIYEYYVFLTLEGEDEGAGFDNVMFSSLFALLPILLVVFLPAFILFYYLGSAGFLMGLVLGTVVGGSSGIVPLYAVLLVALLVAVYVLLIFRNRGGGGSL